MKKGISPLISWILLVAMVISAGAFITFWSTNFIKKFNPEKGLKEDIYCDNVNLKILNACRKDQHTVVINFSNQGSFNVTSLTLYRATELTIAASCLKFLDPNLKPGGELEYYFNVNNTLDTGVIQECPQINNPATIKPETPYVNEISVIPWIKIENTPIACTDRKINVNSAAANMLCSVPGPASFTINADFQAFYDHISNLGCDFPLDFSFSVTNTGESAGTVIPSYRVFGGRSFSIAPSQQNLNPGETKSFALQVNSFDPLDPLCCQIEISTPGAIETSNKISCP
ncbi:hypothetical protein HYX18_02695 [Candidatus Woesearchaeota archaeon]|nr:hypothetical protein [Candidatus Woesearchaeota archaeon]